MAYRYEKNPITKESELVIDGFERGIADSPYGGLASIKNFNISYLPGAVYPNYKRLPASTSGGTGTFIESGSTSGLQTTVYPQSGAGGTNVTMDGRIENDQTNVAFTSLRSAIQGITYVTSGTGDNTNGDNFVSTGSITVSGTNTFAIVAVNNSATTNPGTNLQSVTFNGVTMTYLGSTNYPKGYPNIINYQTYYYYLVNPTSGVVTATFSRNSYAGSLFKIAATVYQGVIQTNPIDVSQVTNSSGTDTLTSTQNADWHIAVGNVSGSLMVAGTNTTIRVQNNGLGVIDNASSIIPAGTNTISYTQNGNDPVMGIIGSMIKPAVQSSGAVVQTTEAQGATVLLSSGTVSGNYNSLARGYFTFDTSAIPDTATVTSAIFSFVSPSKANTFATSPDINLGASTQVTANTLVTADYTAVGTTSFGGIHYTDIVADGSTYNNIPLNATGIAAISLTGVTKFSLQSSWDMLNTPPTWESGKTMSVNTYFADNGNYKPQLQITYTTSGSTNTITVSGITQIKGQDAFTVTNTGGGLPTGLSANTVYYDLQTLNTIGNVFQVSATKAGTPITISSAGTGTQNITLIRPGLPISWTQDPNTGKYFILCYDANSAVKIQVWEFDGVTNYWTLLSGNGQTSNGSDPTAGTHLGIGCWKNYLLVFHDDRIDICGNGTTINQTLWSNNWKTGLTLSPTPVSNVWGTDDAFYWCNGHFIGSIIENVGQTFAPGTAGTYTYAVNALILPTFDTTTWLSELKQNLVIASGNKLMLWDRVSTGFQIALFIKEPILKVYNIRNMLYILAGYKGNMYVSNGYSIDFFKKLPDSFAGTTIDPEWAWGDIMAKHNKLYVGASVINPTPGGVTGVFSVQLTGGDTISTLGVTGGALNYENQNYPGSTVVSGTLENTICLINRNDTPYNNYLSAWYSNGYGGMDYNDSSLYNNFEPTIESDLIPVGTFLSPHTPQNIEFKCDTPLLTGDAISLYARSTINETYHYIGTTSGAGLSANLGSLGLQNMQWLQVKVTVACGSPSSFIRLREIRIK